MVIRDLFCLLALAAFAAGCEEPKPSSGKGAAVASAPAKQHSFKSNPTVVMETSLGTIKIELFADRAPGTVDNFVQYVDEKFYDNTIFHRVVPDFMAQGGGFTVGLEEKPTHGMIKNESFNGVSNKRGTLAMARTKAPDSASAQFFINVKDNLFLDKANAQDGVGYCVFGHVTQGMDVVDKIVAVRTSRATAISKGRDAPMDNVPSQKVIIKSVRLYEGPLL
jgi:peptidyl-prolyl cis-trans isomerase B (cyclophilin B)